MKLKSVRFFLASLFLQGCFALYFLLQYEILVHYDLLKTILPIAAVAALVILLAMWFFSIMAKEKAAAIVESLNAIVTRPEPPLFKVQFLMGVIVFLTLEAFMLSFFSFPPPMRPLFIWLAIACVQAWIMLRVIFAEQYRRRPSFKERIKICWSKWSTVQKRVFIILVILGLIHFAIFWPINDGGRIHGDEEVIYPDLIKLLTTEETLYDTVWDFIIVDNWWYGYPYFPISAAVLVIPRLIFGNDYGQNIQLNLLLLRQFITVLPMTIAIIILVYAATKFKNYWTSIGMFVMMSLIPGVVRNNTRFWHPDSLIVLFVVLAIFFLQRDRLRYGRNFYLSAVSIGLCAAIKLWGLFFFLAVGGYILAGFIEKKINLWGMVKVGLLYLLVMSITILASSPSLLIPWVREAGYKSIADFYPVLREGYDEPDPLGVYRTGLPAWMVFFRVHYMHDAFFYFTLFAAVAGSLIGSQKYLNRLVLAWCLVVGGYLIFFIAKKSFQYMLPLMVPFYTSAFLFPALGEGDYYPAWLAFLGKPNAKRALWGILLIMLIWQLLHNIRMIPISQFY